MLIIEETPEKSFLTFLLSPLWVLAGAPRPGRSSPQWTCAQPWGRCSCLNGCESVLSVKQTIGAWLWKALSSQREIFLCCCCCCWWFLLVCFVCLFFWLPHSSCCASIPSCLHYMLCSPPITRILVTLPFSPDSSFKQHPMSCFPCHAALPSLFTFIY